MTMLDELREILEDAGVYDQVKDKIEELTDEYPEIHLVGREELIYLPKADYMSPIMVDTQREMFRIRDKKSDATTWNYTELRKMVSNRLPWLINHFPDWFKEETSASPVTDAAYSALTYDLMISSFLNPACKADYVISRNKSAVDYYNRSFELYIKTPSGTGTVIVRPLQRGVTKIENGFQIYVSRADLSNPARKDFPRSAVCFKMEVDEHGKAFVTSSNPSVSATVSGDIA